MSVVSVCLQSGGEEKAKTVTESHSQMPVSTVGSRVSVTRTSVTLESPVSASEQKRIIISRLSSPFVRQDIFYPGSITSLREYKNSQDMATYVQVSYLYCLPSRRYS